jgi:fused signal recognition particle receptor
MDLQKQEIYNRKANGFLASFKSVDEELFEELEEILITSDVGVSTT